MSEPFPVRGPVDAATDEFWRPVSLESVVRGVDPWRTEDADGADLTDAEWNAFVSALAE